MLFCITVNIQGDGHAGQLNGGTPFTMYIWAKSCFIHEIYYHFICKLYLNKAAQVKLVEKDIMIKKLSTIQQSWTWTKPCIQVYSCVYIFIYVQ